jgi:MFS transporter, DHA1 family, 2-module integral membrane pump EmrD
MTRTLKEKIWIGVLMASITSLGLMATDIYTPSMPAVTQVLNTSSNMVQLTVTMFLIAACLSQLVYGPLSDHCGRRPVLIIGIVIYIIGSAVCTMAPDISVLLVGRFIQGAGTGAIMSLNRVIIRDTFSGLELVKALSYIGAFVALAPAVAPALGGFIQVHGGWRWVFGFLFIYSIVLIILTWILLPETHQNRSASSLSLPNVIRNYGFIIKNRYFWANVWCSGLALAAMLACATINPFLLQNGLGMNPSHYGVWATISAIGFLAGMLSNSYLVNFLGTDRTIQFGNLLMFSMGLVFIITGYLHILSISSVIIPTIGVEFGIALVFPNAFAGAITPFPMMSGAAGALYGAVQIALTFLSSGIVASLSASSPRPLGFLLLLMGASAFAVYQILNRNKITSPS